MMNLRRSTIKAAAVLAIVSVASAVCSLMSHACITRISWMADLAGASHGSTSASSSRGASGTAEMNFDWAKPFGTLIVRTKNVHDVMSIEMRLIQKPGDLNGPVIAKLYSPKDGPYHGKISKILRQSDIIKQKGANTDVGVADALLHQSVAVAVCTKSHPHGEISGVITPRRLLIYSDGTGSLHDPKLHRTAALGHP